MFGGTRWRVSHTGAAVARGRIANTYSESEATMSSARLWVSLAVILAGAAEAPALQAQILSSNLVYTSVQPCRVIDTRLANNGTNGRLIHGVDQTFNIVGGQVNPNTFSGQGGVAEGCGIPGFDISFASRPQGQAVLLNFVAGGAAG